MILVGDERIDPAELGVPPALMPRVVERHARVIVVVRRALRTGGPFREAIGVELGRAERQDLRVAHSGNGSA